ncbi:MAG: 1-deoxy-D-xylulose-5-phosphate reductoisomerase [Candidatus Protistobacter heckmanni]|nr:1-deoxy-D-xylulose-5-phosphate reductoisomerase [Candidatus Protistobacter heckmanni]
MTRGITLLGATGSVGASTLEVVRANPERFRIHGLTAHTQVEKLFELCWEFRPDVVVVATAEDAKGLFDRLRDAGVFTQIEYGAHALEETAASRGADVVVAAIVGAAGLAPTLAAARAGKRVLLANKEALVMSGRLFMQAAREGGAELLPIDSEHNAIFQCMPRIVGHGKLRVGEGVERILLTASGGPFRQRDPATLDSVTPAEACAHPNWSMGRKISVDSATMMNKGLEVIEAHWLFDAPAERIEVVVHPQSIVHSLVSYADGSVLAQLGNPDMRTPIAHALAYPERIGAGVRQLNLTVIARLDFEPPDFKRFPCLKLAYDALAQGGAAAVLNAANEIAVEAFLQGRIRFTGIARIVSAVLDAGLAVQPDSLEHVLQLDKTARAAAQILVAAEAR